MCFSISKKKVVILKKILIILDGASDLPHTLLNGKTPLEAANMPNLDFLSENGVMGIMYPISKDIAPGSDNSLISIFGNDPSKCKRGIYEAVGAGIKIQKGDLVFRTNFGTIDNLKSRKVIDRRVGRTLTTREAKMISKDINEKVNLPCEFLFEPTVQHRGVLIFRGGSFSENITNVDPEWKGTEVDKNQKNNFDFSKPNDDKYNSKFSSFIVNEFLSQVFIILNNHPINQERIRKGFLPANMLFLRGGGTEIPKIKKYSDWMSINTMPLEIGISKLSNMKTFSFSYPELKNMDSYSNYYQGLNKSINFAIKTLKKQNKNFSGCYIQFKETDVPGHDNRPLEKKKMLEIIDKEFFSFLVNLLDKQDFKIVVTCDHSTPCQNRCHSSDPVPVLLYDGKRRDGTFHFCEIIAREGILGEIYGKDFMKKTGLR
jgi:2,3-bisphosphoglycerate-independent phosphoglycerate mutase